MLILVEVMCIRMYKQVLVKQKVEIELWVDEKLQNEADAINDYFG
jgi:hypothetical protein